MSEDWSWARLVDWERVFSGEPEPEIPWLVEPFIVRGTCNSMYSEVKAGKSLLAQDIGAALASGRGALGYPPGERQRVLYLDFENNQDLIADRYRQMGYGPQDLQWLFYASYPELPMLDTPAGGDAACKLAQATAAALVIIDTTSRVIGGAESSADTFADLYKYTLMRLKQAGHTSLRLDHEGKDATRGARGSSAKGADVDAAWHLTREPGDTLRLRPEYDRTRNLAEFRARLLGGRHQCGGDGGPLRHAIIHTELFGAQIAMAAALDRLGVPVTASRKVCREALRAAGLTARTDDLAAVVKHRKTRINPDSKPANSDPGGSGPPGSNGTAPAARSPGTAAQTAGQNGSDLLGQGLGHTGQPTWDNGPTLSVGLSRPELPDADEWARMWEIARRWEGRQRKAG